MRKKRDFGRYVGDMSGHVRGMSRHARVCPAESLPLRRLVRKKTDFGGYVGGIFGYVGGMFGYFGGMSGYA